MRASLEGLKQAKRPCLGELSRAIAGQEQQRLGSEKIHTGELKARIEQSASVRENSKSNRSSKSGSAGCYRQ
ncbi:hypothetical protein GOP47_0023386 [Adiantum capillus-veneris]|uniref:Uncharacterized protein n=1 Tax=Adiantum capillus-veneris TaxID=13818 RepID=A0A9D4Z5V2_ADICA|nr:hypothetical protein GOP47_0023386 [Adiantum capillus-veneris]